MHASAVIKKIQPYLSNRIADLPEDTQWVAGIIGDRPSQYAKSPSLWNAAFRALGLKAVFLPFDVEAHQLAPLVAAIRESEQIVGFSVTAPYKVDVIKLLGDLNPKAREIGAVNTVARTSAGQLLGFNTDGQGFIDMVTKTLPGQSQPFLPKLDGCKVLLIGAGGAARAVAFYLSEMIGPAGHMTIANRNSDKARELAESVKQVYGNASWIGEEEIGKAASKADMIVNGSTKGQTGLRKLSSNRITCLEPYSALAPAHPVECPQSMADNEPAFYAAWYKDSLADIHGNHAASNDLVVTIPAKTVFIDLVYAPLETRMLAHARLSGHRTLNGKGMNIAQACDGFVNRVMRDRLLAQGGNLQQIYGTVFETMAKVW